MCTSMVSEVWRIDWSSRASALIPMDILLISFSALPVRKNVVPLYRQEWFVIFPIKVF